MRFIRSLRRLNAHSEPPVERRGAGKIPDRAIKIIKVTYASAPDHLAPPRQPVSCCAEGSPSSEVWCLVSGRHRLHDVPA